MKKYTAFWELPVFDDHDNEMYCERDEKQFDTLIEAITWLGDKDNNPSYYCIVYVNATGRIAHVGWLN